MKGYIINRTGNFMHVFKMTLDPNKKIFLDELYKGYASKMTIEEFIEHIKSKTARTPGIDIVDLDISNPDLPKEIRVENQLHQFNQDISSVTPKVLSEMEYNEDTKHLINQIDSTRLLAYAKTLAKKNNKSKHLQNALDKRYKELKGAK